MRFLESRGLEEAKRLTGYCDAQVKRIFHDERTWIYLMILIDETASKLGLSKAEELKKLQKMIDDPNIPGSSRIAAQLKLVEWLHAEPETIKGGFLAVNVPYALEEATEKALPAPKDTSPEVGGEQTGEDTTSDT